MLFERLRQQYSTKPLLEKEAPDDPVQLFSHWLQTAIDGAPADWVDPFAMTLATSSPLGEVSARIVLLRGHDEHGLVFYSNYQSHKGQQLSANPRAELVFYWGYLHRQVRVTGTVGRVSREESAAYFASRPRGSQISAAVSRQSTPVSDRGRLEQTAAELSQALGDQPVPLPESWGGYRLAPTKFEFWQGRPDRLHDRLVYRRETDAGWRLVRLSP